MEEILLLAESHISMAEAYQKVLDNPLSGMDALATALVQISIRAEKAINLVETIARDAPLHDPTRLRALNIIKRADCLWS